MIGVDTNVFLRFLVLDDDEKQRDLARQFMNARTADDPAFISSVTLAETVWVLNKKLKYPQAAIYAALTELFTCSEFIFEAQQELMRLLYQKGPVHADLADYLITWAGIRANCDYTVTFDKKAARSIPSMELLT